MLTQEKLKEVIHYDPVTGKFTWLKGSPSAPIGSEAGSLNGERYRYIEINYVPHKANRLAVLYMEGYLPDFVDHINCKPWDDSYTNLRIVTKTENAWNRGMSSLNTSGVKGMSINKSGRKLRWNCCVVANGKRHFKYFPIDLKEDAIKWIKNKREELHGEFANHG